MKKTFVTPDLPQEVFKTLPAGLKHVKLNLIAGLIYEHWLLKIHLLEDDFVPIHSLNFKVIDRSYKQYVDHLINHNIIKSDCYYIIGKKSISYSFTHEINSFKQISIKNTRFRTLSKDSIKKYPQIYYDLHRIEAMESEAFKYLDHSKKSHLSHHAYCLATCHLLKVINKDYYFHLGSNGCRLHTNITCMKKELRNFLTIENERLVEIDIVNSQPFFSTILLRPADPAFFKIVNNLYIEENYKYNPMWCKMIQSIDSEDINKYINLVQEGLIYEYFQRLFSSELHDQDDLGVSREEVKKMVMYILYSSDYVSKTETRKARFKRMFKDAFPVVYKIFHELKKHRYNRLAIINQRIEAYLVLDIIYSKLKNQLKIPIITIHDSFALPAPYLDKAIKIIEEVIYKKIGRVPILKHKVWDPKNLIY